MLVNKIKTILKSRSNQLIIGEYHQDPHQQEKWLASSDYQELEVHKLSNNIAFYVFGEESYCNELKLVLNINDISSEVAAKEYLIACCKDIYKAIAEKSLPSDVESFIRFTKQSKETLLKCTGDFSIIINFLPFTHSDIDGYEIQFITKIEKH
ncbi:hypothetical protein LZP73_14240 [Shewanella sp. AS16]|uniref:hypothetical protein n=1 Tax=Shewanella sp. AS16 TaxID=2907625 RepID=UPI001F16F057|nr:hypothetical protein [Shewanella sp. AS16]MCE9687349.1 hypothetical protein [Shewanella sp. AS16]